MQFKSFGEAVRLSGPLQLMWNRISFSRLTIIYFLFSIAHFVIQLSIQIKAFSINAEASHFLSSIVNEAQTTNNSLPLLHGPILRMCSWVPSNLNVDVVSCPVIWNGSASNDANVNAVAVAGVPSLSSLLATETISVQSVSSTASASVSTSSSLYEGKDNYLGASASTSAASTSTSTSATRPHTTQTVTVFITAPATPKASSIVGSSETRTGFSPLGNAVDKEDAETEEDPFNYHNFRRDVQIIPSQVGDSVEITLVGLDQGNIKLDNACLWALNWPVSVLGNTKREDMVFMAFQVWVLGMSVVAILNESIPHILASLVTHMMATAWAAFQISHTAEFRSDFNRVITHGACNVGVSLLPNYWEARSKAEIPSLALNIIALFISSLLTWKLIKLFGWQTFKRVGASLTINRIYKLVLILSITIQLSLFFMIVTVSLWVDQLTNSVIGDLATSLKLYKVTSFLTLALLIPWLMTGWFAVRRELRVPMFIFLSLSVLYLGGWGFMFFSTTFRWTFTTWIFFSIMASASVFLTFIAVVLGVICRMNFGKGLARYLNAQQLLEDDDFKTPYGESDFEKVAFPSSEKPLPTYASYNDYEAGFLPSLHSGSVQGPRFSNKNAEPFETSVPGLPYPPPVVQRNLSDVHVFRTNSHGSTRSDSSEGSHARTDSSNSHSNHKRWVIE